MNEASPRSGAQAQSQVATFRGDEGGGSGGAVASMYAALSRPAPVAMIVFAFALAAALFAWRAVEQRETRIVAERFENVATQFLSEIQRSQGVHEQSLRAGAALLAVTGQVSAAQWRTIYDNLRVADRLPGVQGFGFAEAVTPAARAEHVARIQAQGFPHYAIEPAGDREFYTPIAYLEPFDWRNQRAHGFDMFSDPERRQAMIRAAETGMTAATGRVRLVQETETNVQPGFLLYVPVYRSGAALVSLGGPFPGLMGFVYSPVRVADFFNSIMATLGADVASQAIIQVFDGPEPAPEALIFSSGAREDAASGLAIQRAHDLFGRAWTVRMSPSRAFLESFDRRDRRELLIGGLVLSVMAGALAWLVAQRQRQREEAALRNDMIAREMSHRVKNLLAVIQAIAARTMSGGRSLQEARLVFSDRISALARAHSALVDGRWSGALLRDLLEGELAPFGARVSMSGPHVLLNSQMAQNMAMAVHELATNAVKYGALSTNAGIVRIVWAIRETASGERTFSFSWEETGGPPVKAPEREGFGQTLLRRLMGSAIGTEPVAEYSNAGFRYRFECPIERIVSPPSQEGGV